MAEIRLEVASENAILEIQYDGHEIRQPPLSMSEQLSQHARKIDFGAAENGGSDELSGPAAAAADETEEQEEDEEEEKPCQQPHWPLESVRNKIRNAHTEVCVLHDLLQMVREKRYLVLDHVQGQQHQPKLYIQFLSLKKSLNNAASILTSGAERIRSSQSSVAKPASDFHLDLLRLRQHWRLKRVATNIVGDLSYTNTGSKFRHSGYFEVSKADDDSVATPLSSLPGSATSSASSAAAVGVSRSSLRVTIPPELDGSAYIFVCIRKDEEDLCSTQLNMIGGLNNVSSNASCGGSGEHHWQQKLECAQNVLFCKELFSQLAREAVALKMDIPPLVVANQITATIFPGIHLLIALCHSHPDSSRNRSSLTGPNGFLTSGAGNSSGSSSVTGSGSGQDHHHQQRSSGGTGGSVSKSIHDGVLEHSLHQLMHDYLHRTTPVPHPVYAPLHAHPTRRIAGPHGLDRQQLMQTVTNETLLEQIIKEAQHNFLRLRTMFVIDQLAIELRDPLIISHWNLFNSPTQSCVRINIVTQSYDSVIRTTLVVHVYERSLRCVCRDGRVMTMSFEPQELRNLLLCQVAQHQMAAVQSLSKLMGWTVGCSEPCLGVGAAEPLGSAAAVVLTAPSGNKQIMVRSGPCTGVSVSVATAPRNDFYPSGVVNERRWDQLPGAWQEVRLASMEGRNFLNKIELLMAALTAQN
uniref:Mediator of RNA polymerase II transcription subunit 17-like n=2 Tax=Hirondellea gigas TaxID=1518452 RepID=A0A2P2IC97_9CRUS